MVTGSLNGCRAGRRRERPTKTVLTLGRQEWSTALIKSAISSLLPWTEDQDPLTIFCIGSGSGFFKEQDRIFVSPNSTKMISPFRPLTVLFKWEYLIKRTETKPQIQNTDPNKRKKRVRIRNKVRIFILFLPHFDLYGFTL